MQSSLTFRKTIQDFVTIKEDTHQYFDVGGKEYKSVTKVIGSLSKPFNENFWAPKTAKKLGITTEEVLNMWKEKRDGAAAHGTRIHSVLENYTNANFDVPEELKPLVSNVCNFYEDEGYKESFSEVILYDFESAIAGTTDKVHFVNKTTVDIEDYKTNISKGIEFCNKYGDSMLHPVKHFSDCNYNKYAIQLSIYAYMLEKLKGFKIRKLYITFIPPDTYIPQRIPVNYLKTDVVNILKWHKDSQESIASDGLNDFPTFDQFDEARML